MRKPFSIPYLSETHLENNLRALALRSPELCRWIQDCRDDEEAFQVQMTASGKPNILLERNSGLLLHSATDPVQEAEKEVGKLQCGPRQAILCLGVGLGYYLEALLRRHNPCQPVTAYERSPLLLMLALMRTDFMRDILAGRLKFLSPPDILKSRPADRKGFHLWPHPVLGPLYDWEKTLFASQAVTAGPYRRALVISGGLFSLDVSEALRDTGLEVLSWNPPCSEQQHIIKEIISLHPHLIVSINYRHGLPEISRTLGIPLLVWEIDPSIERLAPHRVSHPDTYIYTYRKANIPRFREAGFEHVEYLPLAANPKRRYPKDLSDEEADRWGADVSFAGSSMAAQAEALRQLYFQLTRDRSFPPSAKTDDPVRDYASLWDTAIASQSRNPDGYVIEELFREYLPQSSWVAADEEERLVDLAVCTAETAASERRAQALNTLSQLDSGFRIRVWGDEGWSRILPDNIQYRGPVGHFHELTSVYNASRINLDVNRIYQRDIATMRVFDVLACKGFLLADWSDDLGELFQLGSEVLAYRSLGEIPSLVRHFLTHLREREEIAEAGYQRVLREHTIQSRVECMLDHLP